MHRRADDTNCADIPQQKWDDEHNRFQQNHLVNISHEVITFQSPILLTD